MKRSVVNGKYIYDNLNRLYAEVRELDQACDEVNNGTLPHRILKQHLEDKVKELKQAENEQFEGAL